MRLSYSWNAAINKLEILDRNDYYPFGMNFVAAGAGAVYDPKGSPLNYKFGTKELQETGIYDFGARMLMPDVGRWFSVDPLAEKNTRLTPYHYAANNPIRNIDPDGRMDINFTGEAAKEVFVQLRDAQDERNKKGGVRFVLNIGDGADMRDAAKTRMKEIKQNYPNDKLIEITDSNLGNLSKTIAKHLKVAHKEGYGKTYEVSIFSHASTDGPVGSYDSNNPYDLSNESGDAIDKGQMSLEGWSKIDWNFDPTNSVAAFYGCQSDSFAEKFMYISNAYYTAGVGGRAGGTESMSGNFNGTVLNFMFSNSGVYLRSQTDGKVDPLTFYRRGYTQKIGDKRVLKPIEYYRNATVPSK